MMRGQSKVPTLADVGTFGKLTISWAAGRRRMADCVSAKIITPARAFVNPLARLLCNKMQGGRLWAP